MSTYHGSTSQAPIQALPISVPIYQPGAAHLHGRPPYALGTEPVGLAAGSGNRPAHLAMPAPYPGDPGQAMSQWASVVAAPRPYVGPLQAMDLFFRNGTTFQGRASRSEFWWPTLFTTMAMVLSVISMAILVAHGSGAVAVVMVLLGLGLLLPTIALTSRRLHDANLSAALFCLYFITYVGWIPVWVLCALPSDPRGAQYDDRTGQPAH